MASATTNHNNEIQGAENPSWNNCWNHFSTSKWNPNNWDLTFKKVAQIAAIVLAACIVVVAVSALMVQYPQAMGAFFTMMGIVGFISLAILSVATVKYFQQTRGMPNGAISISTNTPPQTSTSPQQQEEKKQ